MNEDTRAHKKCSSLCNQLRPASSPQEHGIVCIVREGVDLEGLLQHELLARCVHQEHEAGLCPDDFGVCGAQRATAACGACRAA